MSLMHVTFSPIQVLRGARICQYVLVVIGGPRVVLTRIRELGLEIARKAMCFLEISPQAHAEPLVQENHHDKPFHRHTQMSNINTTCKYTNTHLITQLLNSPHPPTHNT